MMNKIIKPKKIMWYSHNMEKAKEKLAKFAHNMTQSESQHGGIGKGWILLDSQSNCSIF